jgi:hypothetical protein
VGSPDKFNSRDAGDEAGGSFSFSRSELLMSNDGGQVKELRGQVEHLSKLLMKKQNDLIDTQSERSALKSKTLDLQARCSSLEQQVASLRDLEDDGYGYKESASTASGLSQRRGPAQGKTYSGEGGLKMLSDLERFGVKPGVGVSRAVTIIDTWAVITGRYDRATH